MDKRAFPGSAVIICIALLAIVARAQDEQWLRYHSAREVRLVGFSSNSRNLEVITEKPDGVALPEFKPALNSSNGSDEPVFAKWPTPMVQNGYLWIALHRTHNNGPHDKLYIDSNGDGSLNNETAFSAYRTTQNYTYFGPVKVVFQIEDGPVTYHLNFQFYGSADSSRKRLYASSGGWYEGDVAVNGAKKHCVLFDYNANGTFNDKALDPDESDRIRIGRAGSQDTRFVGNYLDVDGKYFIPEIARDGACIKLAEAKDVKFGKVRLPESVTELSAGGENGLFTVKPENKVAPLPVGKYRIVAWTIERKDDKETSWKLQASRPEKETDFEINAEIETALSVGEPIVSSLNSRQRNGTHYFDQSLKGRNGERITFTRNGARPQAPKLNIKNKDGTYDRTYSFSYG